MKFEYSGGVNLFIAENDASVRFCSFEIDETLLRSLALMNSLVCPDCFKTVRFRAGTKKPHFFHYTKKCMSPNPFYETETDAHRNGKLLIYNWLKEKFKECRVELEYYLPETKQRSDIMLLFPEGERIAFEFQCSLITGSIWNERHQLYKKAGIQDIWILNHDMKRYSESHGCQSLNGLEAAILKSTMILQYLKLSTQEVTIILLGKTESKYVYESKELISPLDLIYLKDSMCWSDQFEEFMINYKLQIHLRELAELNYIEEQERIFENRHIEMEKRKELEIHNRKQHYINTMNERKLFTNKFTLKERELFDKLNKKYAFSAESFPGLFHIEVEHGNLIVTPPQLWQLWLFDRYIYQKIKNNKKSELPKIWLEHTIADFKTLRNEGIFRTNSPTEKANYTFVIYNYIRVLNEAQVLQNLGNGIMKYQKVLCSRIPIYSTHKENSLIKMMFEGYKHESINEMKDRFLEDIKECHYEARLQLQSRSNIKPIMNITVNKSYSKPDKETAINKDSVNFIITQIEKVDRTTIPLHLLYDFFQCINISEKYKKTGDLTQDQYMQLNKYYNSL